MQIYDSFQQFWDEYALSKPNNHGFYDWTVVRLVHTSDKDYQTQKHENNDELGFQPLTVTLANAFEKQSKLVIIKNVNNALAADFARFSRERYLSDLPKRFGSFRPGETNAYTEYDDWPSFNSNWLERNDVPVFQHNVPLLIDHTPKVEYWLRKQTGETVLPYQRLLITTFFASKNQFFDFFIKNVDDEAAHQINMLLQSRISLSAGQLFAGVGENG